MKDAGAKWDDRASHEIGAALSAQPGFIAYTVVRTGEWEVVAHPYMGAGGKIAYARVRRVDQPAVVDVQSWSAHERISVKRT